MEISDSSRHMINILDKLEAFYGIQKNIVYRSPLDELILVILSQSTTSSRCMKVFVDLKTRFNDWNEVRRADPNYVSDVIHSCGLSKIKTKYIIGVLDKIYKETNELNLDFLNSFDNDNAVDYLLSFKGVGRKTAACVLMFSLGREILPVDTHILRISKRIRIVSCEAPMDDAYDILNRLIPAHRKFSAHINMISLGRKICCASVASCDICPINDLCVYNSERRS